jgi:L-iditol 2-dehydrogenase
VLPAATNTIVKTLLLTDLKKLEIAASPLPVIEKDEALVRVHACGICGSDVHGYDGSSGRRIPPLIMGHEASGVIEKIGGDVSGFAPGARVTFDSTISCGRCDYCRSGRTNLCDNRMVLGVSCGSYRRHGAFAEFVAVPARILFTVPDNLSFEHAAMVEPVAVAAHAARQTPVVPGGTAIVVGCGMIGLLIIQTLRLIGWSRIIAVDLDASRLQLASSLGAHHTLNSGKGDALKNLLDLTNGKGADTAFEAVGISATVKLAISAVRKGGSVVLVGNIAPEVNLPLQSVVTREISLHGSCAFNDECAVAIHRLAAGEIQVKPLISAVAPLEEGPAWFDRLYRSEPGLMKVILQPNSPKIT